MCFADPQLKPWEPDCHMLNTRRLPFLSFPSHLFYSLLLVRFFTFLFRNEGGKSG
jgi:hypothetical protein